MASTLQQLRDEALTYLVLWAASKEYSPDIEAALKHWAATFEIPETELMERIVAASTGRLSKPDPNAPAAAEETAAEGAPAADIAPAADTAPAVVPADDTGIAPAAEQQQQQQQQPQQQQQEQQPESMEQDL